MEMGFGRRGRERDSAEPCRVSHPNLTRQLVLSQVSPLGFVSELCLCTRTLRANNVTISVRPRSSYFEDRSRLGQWGWTRSGLGLENDGDGHGPGNDGPSYSTRADGEKERRRLWRGPWCKEDSEQEEGANTSLCQTYPATNNLFNKT